MMLKWAFLLTILALFSGVLPLNAQDSEPCVVRPSAPSVPPDEDLGQELDGLDTETFRLLWNSLPGTIVYEIQSQLDSVLKNADRSTRAAVHYAKIKIGAPGQIVELLLVIEDFEDGRYKIELLDSVTSEPVHEIIIGNVAANLSVQTVATTAVAFTLGKVGITLAAMPVVTTVAVITTSFAVVYVADLIVEWATDGTVDKLSTLVGLGLTQTLIWLGQAIQAGTEVAVEFVGSAGVWVFDMFSNARAYFQIEPKRIAYMEAFVNGQCYPLTTHLATRRISEAVGLDEVEFLEVNDYLAYQSSPDGDLLDYLANRGLRATLPGGISMDVGELILRIQLGIPVLDTIVCEGAPPSRLVVGGQGYVLEGASPINVRDQAGLSGRANQRQLENNTIFTVLDGPACMDGYAWWEVEFDCISGWAAEGQGEDYWLAPIYGRQSNNSQVDANWRLCYTLAEIPGDFGGFHDASISMDPPQDVKITIEGDTIAVSGWDFGRDLRYAEIESTNPTSTFVLFLTSPGVYSGSVSISQEITIDVELKQHESGAIFVELTIHHSLGKLNIFLIGSRLN